MKRHGGIVSGRIGSFIFACIIFLSKLPSVASALLSRHAFGFQFLFHPAGVVVRKKKSHSSVCECKFFFFFIICVNVMSDGLQCVFALFGVVVTCFRQRVRSLLRAKEIMITDGLFPFFVGVGWCCGTISCRSAGLVATQNTRSDKLRTLSIQRCPPPSSLPSRPLASTPPPEHSIFR